MSRNGRGVYHNLKSFYGLSLVENCVLSCGTGACCGQNGSRCYYENSFHDLLEWEFLSKAFLADRAYGFKGREGPSAAGAGCIHCTCEVAGDLA